MKYLLANQQSYLSPGKQVCDVVLQTGSNISNPPSIIYRAGDMKVTECVAYDSIHYQNDDEPIYVVIV